MDTKSTHTRHHPGAQHPEVKRSALALCDCLKGPFPASDFKARNSVMAFISSLSQSQLFPLLCGKWLARVQRLWTRILGLQVYLLILATPSIAQIVVPDECSVALNGSTFLGTSGDCNGLLVVSQEDFLAAGGNVEDGGTQTYQITFGSVSYPLNTWYTGNIQDMKQYFASYDFSQNSDNDISNWDTSNVTDMTAMFYYSTNIPDIRSWDTSKVQSFASTFDYAREFNQNIGNWNTSSATTMSAMFWEAQAFNQDIGEWDTGKVENMESMFRVALTFNQDISGWDTSSVSNMELMFQHAQAFDQDISEWDVGLISSKPSNFDFDTLAAWLDAEKPNWDAPAVKERIPSDGAIDVDVESTLQMTFDQFVARGENSESIFLYDASNHSLIDSFLVGTGGGGATTTGVGAVAFENSDTLTLTPSQDLTPDTTYYVLTDTGIVTSDKGTFVGSSNPSNWTFTTASDTASDTTPPTIITLSPSNEAAGVAVNAEFSITFDEDVVAGANPHISIYQADFEEAVFESNEGNFSGSTATFKLTSDLSPNTSYYVLIDSTAIEDLAGNSFGGIADASVWTFTTASDTAGDTTPPTIITLSPSNEAAGVAVNAEFSITFDEDVVAGANPHISIYQADFEEAVFESNEGNFSGSTATFKLTSDLSPNTSYYVLIDSTAIEDLAGNSFGGIADASVWTFTTASDTAGDTTPPTIITLSPSNEAAGVAVNAEFSITFDEDVVAGANPHISIYQADFEEAVFESNEGNFSGSTATFKLTSDLSPNTSYYVLIDSTAIEDLAGNSFGGIADASVWTFTTASDTASDTTPPTIITLSPSNEAAGVAVNAEFSITFDEDVVAGANPHISIYQADFEEAVFESNEGNFSGSTATFKLTSDLSPNTSYYVLIDSTAIEDLAGNSFGGIADASVWTFTTASDTAGDTTPPTIITLSPSNEAAGVAVNAEFSITFDEDVVAGANPHISIYQADFEEAVFESNEGNFSGSTATFKLTSDLSPNTSYYVLIDSTAIEDLAGNSFGGIADASVWTFTTASDTAGDTTPPTRYRFR